MALSPGDPSSFSRPDQVRTTHIHMEVELDFTQQVVAGHVVLSLERLDPAATSVILDARKLQIFKVTEAGSGNELQYQLGSPSGFGEKLEVELPVGGGER